jgi:hypothetical protein
MLSFSTAIKIYNSPSVREIQRLIQKDEQQMKESQAQQSEAQNKQMQADREQAMAMDDAQKRVDLEKFNRTDETTRYIAELKAETDRLKLDNDERGIISAQQDNDDLAKFEAELGIKKEGLENDMKKHKDLMSRKDQEITIKEKQVNKPNTTK